MDFYIAMGSLFLAIGLMTLLMLHNLRELRKTKDLRIVLRRAEKREKNEKLRRAFNLPDKGHLPDSSKK